jgi:hypothetical protein
MRFIPRDISVMTGILKYRLLTTTMAAILYFSSIKTAKRRLRMLNEVGLLGRFARHAVGVGRSEYVYFVTQKGVSFLIDNGVALTSSCEPKRLSSGNHGFIEHMLGINEFLVRLEAACARDGGFISEFRLCDRIPGAGLRSQRSDADMTLHSTGDIDLIADAVFSIENNFGKKLLFFLEYDRGTEIVGNASVASSGTISDKIRRYITAYDSEEYTKFNALFNHEFRSFRTLFVTTSGKRAENIIATAEQAEAEGIIWVTSMDAIINTGILGDNWRVAGYPNACFSIIKSMQALALDA